MAYRKETNDNVVKIFELMVALESVVSHNKKQHILDVAGVKAKITKMLPLNTVCEDVDMLFVNTNCQRVLGDYLQDKLIGRGLKEPTERDVALRAIKAFFSSYMRAHMVVGNPDFKRYASLMRLVSKVCMNTSRLSRLQQHRRHWLGQGPHPPVFPRLFRKSLHGLGAHCGEPFQSSERRLEDHHDQPLQQREDELLLLLGKRRPHPVRLDRYSVQ